MKIKLLKHLRKITWSKYEVKKDIDDNTWRIYTLPKTSLAYYEYTTREAAINKIKTFWHIEAEKYLWNHRELRKHKNKYPW